MIGQKYHPSRLSREVRGIRHHHPLFYLAGPPRERRQVVLTHHQGWEWIRQHNYRKEQQRRDVAQQHLLSLYSSDL
ncbi:hypothetical protein KPTA6363_017490 [Klebsiella pneumoniae]|nr:hypothetical protein KPTA6363_017490 [Klebsiella pneumoniae]